MNVADFDFELPTELIAQEPPAERGQSRLLVLDRATGDIVHSTIDQLGSFLASGDLIVVNDTRVFPARLLGRRHPSGGQVECLLIRRLESGVQGAPRVSDAAQHWEALMHPGQKLREGERVVFESAGVRIVAEILKRQFYGRRTIRIAAHGTSSIEAAIEQIGHVPLPPYIKRPDTAADRERYQTVFARAPGSVAAPTAGLHFTGALLEDLAARGVERTAITLHVGYGTFKPVRGERVEEHEMDAEAYEISESAADALNRARAGGRRIVAVGTTTTRALEAAVRTGEGRVLPAAALTNLFIFPGFSFALVGALLTNFHLPRSSLLMLVSAFAGRERVLGAYRDAVAHRYRFYSYGDAMLIT
jgi:S-adenosylmethionine:tRNA ribosyltransferase-isomerase